MKNTTEEIEHYRCLIPSGLDLLNITQQNPPDFEADLGLLHYLVHLTIEVPARNKDLLTKTGYVPFKAGILQSKSRMYRQHLDYLVEQGVLDEDRQYRVGKHCRHFRIAERYLSNRLKEFAITDTKMLKVLERHSNIDFDATIKYKKLYQWFDGSRLKVDVQAAEAYIWAELAHNKRESYYEAYITAYTKILKVRMIDEGAFWFNVDDFGHRLHTNLTNLDKCLKPFITFDGLNLVSVDVKNSQPFFSLKIFQGRNNTTNTLTYHLSSQPTSLSTNPTSHNECRESIMIVKGGESLDNTGISSYRGEVVRGTLYEFLASEMRKEFGEDYFTKTYYDVSKGRVVESPPPPRQRVKGVLYQVFFSKNSSHSREKDLFRRLFPDVMRVFEEYKGNIHIPVHNRHKKLAKELQRIESGVMLDKVVKEISRLRPDLPIFTIHDCIVTTVGNEEFIQQVMKQVITAAMGFAPPMKTEYWCRDCSPMKLVA